MTVFASGLLTARSPLRILGVVWVLVTALGLSSAPAAHADDPPAVVLPTVAGWPVAQPQVLTAFDPPDDPWGAGHRGVDLTAPVGTPVVAAASGTITFAAVLAGRGVVVVDHGSVRTTYEPVTASVKVGQQVQVGATIGVVEATAGRHCPVSCLHWGLLAGETYLDPLLLVGRDDLDDPRVRLLPRDAVAAAEQRQRARASASSEVGVGPGGQHGFVRPVPGPITSPFGMRLHPVLHVWKLHDGTDLGAPCGTPIRAPAAGIVTERSFNVGYGNRLFVDHGRVDGYHVMTGYNHAMSYVVAPGDRVVAGQVLGYVGTTGYSTGCHLHLMVWLDQKVVDPMTWF